MELTKAKYKQTEVGMIPEDWKVNTLGKVAFVTKLAGFEYSLHFNSYRDEGDIIVVRGTNITHNKMDLRDIKTIPTSTSNKLLRSKLFKNDLVFAYVGTIGPIFLIEEDDRYHLGPNTAKISVEKDINSKYLYHYFTSSFIANEIFETTSIGAQPSLSMTKIRSFKIITPTLKEQKAIATALSDVDALISNLDQLIIKKKAIKQGAMQQLLTPPHKGGKRLDGFTGEWERIAVSKVINVARGGSPRPIQDFMTNSSKGINWIKIGDTSRLSKYIVSSKEKIIPEGEQYSRSVKKGDFLLSNSMSFGRPYILKIDGCIHDGWLVLQNYQDSFDREFLYYTLMSKDVFDQYLSKASGSGVLNLNKELVKVVELNRPKDLNEQKAIAQILSDIDLDLEQLETKKAKYQDIKQGMMQELLTGKTRLV